MFTFFPGSCVLWVSQPPEMRAKEGTTVLLPCSFNASRRETAIGSVTWYQDKLAPAMEMGSVTPKFRGHVASFVSPSSSGAAGQSWSHRTPDSECAGARPGRRNGKRAPAAVEEGEVVGHLKTQCAWKSGAVPSAELLNPVPVSLCPAAAPAPPASHPERAASILLWAVPYALSFLSVAVASAIQSIISAKVSLGAGV